MKVFLDDERIPVKAGWTIVRSFEQFVETVAFWSDEIVEMTFDHDLGPSPLKNGMDCVRWMVERALDNPTAFERLERIVFHSANPDGVANMRGLLESAIRHEIFHEIELVDYSCILHSDHAIMPFDFNHEERKMTHE